MLDSTQSITSVAIMGVERGYRKEHIDVVMSDTPVAVRELGDPTTNELDQLLEKYQKSGLIGDRKLSGNRQGAISALRGDPIAISVCRILNDFRPLDRIVNSLWKPLIPSSGRFTLLVRWRTIAMEPALGSP